jgi:hypothetical protein
LTVVGVEAATLMVLAGKQQKKKKSFFVGNRTDKPGNVWLTRFFGSPEKSN